MKRPVFLCWLVIISLLAATGFAQSQRRMQLDDLGRIVRVSDPQISPDGKSIVTVVARANYDENRYDANLVLVDVATGNQRVLTQDRRGVSHPRFSPSGDRLAFLATVALAAGQQPRAQIFIMPMGGGDVRRITSAPKGVQQFAWSPDGRAIAFATEDEADKKTGPERFNDSFEVGNDDFLISSQALPTHAWLVPADGGEARRLTSGTWSLPISHPPGPPASPLTWSPDGRSLVTIRLATPHSGDALYSTIQVVDVTTGKMRAVTGRDRSEGQPTFSPDGSQIAYWQSRDAESGNLNEIHIAPSAGGPGRSITRALDRNIARSIWMPDGKSMLVGANDGTRVSLWVQPLEGAARKLDLGKLSPSSSFWVDVAVGKDGAIAFTATESSRPAEVYYMASPTSSPKRLTDLNAEVAGLNLGRTEVISWQSEGLTHNGILTYPPDFSGGQKYPLVLVIHGGPTAASLETFGAQAQIMAAKGWVVFQPNYRGSDQIGNAYQRAIVNDAGAGPGRDVMAGIEAVKQRGFVDTSRIAVSGWSYGGYMTTWLLGHYSGWRVAMAGAAVTDWMDQYNLGDANVRRGAGFGGSPWTDAKRLQSYMDQSPIASASKIRTPTLIMTNNQDFRVPPMQSFKLYHALRDNGVPTKFVAYPIYGHNAGDPVRQRDVQRRWIEWIEQHFNEPPWSGK
ncbi:MAG TPA: S9 family peptidase [Blastocatellia bacterium]|nr:S9 family peptidase [Blastocatellia bacterium]